MADHFWKFIFLGVLVAAVLFSRLAYPAATPSTAQKEEGRAVAQAAAPLFVLPSVAVSAGGAPAGNASDTTILSNGIPGIFMKTDGAKPPAVGAAASLVADLATGAVFEARNPVDRWPTASIAKLMSATIVVDKLDPNARISITTGMLAEDPGESTLKVGDTYAVSDLLPFMLLPSSNVAAEAVASFHGRDAFVKEMNARAVAWGMKNTYFNDPSGISTGDQSTAADLLTLAGKIQGGYPEIFAISRTPEVTVTELNSRTRVIIKSINDFAGQPDFIGGKTGHTDEAAGNLLSVFRYKNRAIAVIVLGSQSRFLDSQKLYRWFTGTFK